MTAVRPVLVIHGGAGSRIAAARRARLRRQLTAICDEAYVFLQRHSALESVVWAVERLEDDPWFNAGTGSVLQADGRAWMSASVMDGARGRFGGVLNVERVRHPVRVARALLDGPDRLLAGPGATRFAQSLGMPVWDPVTPERLRAWRRRHRDRTTQGTVGAVALDAAGRLAAATSTGGKPLARLGRVSDSGMPVGNFADARVAVICTGLGEDIIEDALAVRIAQQVADGRPLPRAMALAQYRLRHRRRRAAAIGIDRKGRMAWTTTLNVLLAVGRAGRRRVVSF